MTTATQNEEDLIILWDETSSDTSMIDFSFPAQNSQIQEETSDFIIDFGDTTQNEVSTDFVLDNTTSEVKSDEIFFGEDIFWVTDTSLSDVTMEETPQVEEVSQVETSEIDFGFSAPVELEETSVMEEIQEVKSEQEITEISNTVDFLPVEDTRSSSPEEMSFDRNTILDEAIAKMQSRKSSIAQIKSSKQSKADELNEQIKLLKSQVSDLQKEISDFDKEDSALDSDILSIEKMKTNVLEIAKERARKHNLSNIKK